MLMGIYLIIIAYKDARFRGIYNREAYQWMSSWLCTSIGIIAMVSSEVKTTKYNTVTKEFTLNFEFF